MAKRPTINFRELFQPRQWEALQAVLHHKYVLYGGAAGGGKSFFLRWIAVFLLCYWFQTLGLRHVRLGIFCEDYPALNERHLSKVNFEFPLGLGKLNKSAKEYTLAEEYGGGVIAFRNLDDPSKYLSSEFAAVLVDELTRNERKTFDFLAGMRMRWPGIGDTKFVGATNPGSIGHLWVKKLWIDRDFVGEDHDPNNFAFVQALYSDNKFLDPQYEAQLNTLPHDLREAYKNGNWDVFEGQFFKQFNRAVHVVEPFEIPQEWRRIRCIDYGYAAPFVCLWIAEDFDGNAYVYRQLRAAGIHASEQAEQILDLSQGENIYETYMDPSMWAKIPGTYSGGKGYTMQSIADFYAEAGLDAVPANNDRLSGVNVVNEYLNYADDQPPRLRIFSNCKSLITTLPALVHDEKRPEDVNTDGDDHDYDALRYGLKALSGGSGVAVEAEEDREPFDPAIIEPVNVNKDPRVFW